MKANNEYHAKTTDNFIPTMLPKFLPIMNTRFGNPPKLNALIFPHCCK
jgi:hypothetical protein